MRLPSHHPHGFSLVELSIVLVILGLLTGGVLAGQSLIRAAELRSLATQSDQYVAAAREFRDLYKALPGDLPNATMHWGAAAGDGYNATCAAFSSTSKATCNGNGDGNIHTAGATVSESYRAWQHLANAGLIEGQYTGTAGSAGYADATPKTNQPAAKIGTSGWTMIYSDGGWTYGKTGNSIWVGADGSGHAYSFYGMISPEEAWSLDTKLDDGKPGQGKLLAPHGYTTTCASTAVATTAEYVVASKGNLCALAFWIE